MNEIEALAAAKINLSLDVTAKREDGYHSLKTVMAQIPLYDRITVRKSPEISVKTNLIFLPEDNGNIAYKAAGLFFKYTGISGGAEIIIEKKIPVSAGLAGGSADGAAVLKALNRLYETGLPLSVLSEIGDKIGKDIPFCLRGGVCLAEGTGEKLTVLPKIPECYIVLTKPSNINVSTKSVFTALDVSEIELRPDTAGIISGLYEGDIIKIARRMYNVLEDITVKLHPKIAALKQTFSDYGADGMVMSGSGPSVFGIFRDGEAAKSAYAALFAEDRQTFLIGM
jgi:4-diphosphocytidyl-2-C-methyl-D-erythritol kinase